MQQRGRKARLKEKFDSDARYFQRNGKSGRTKKAARRWLNYGPCRMPML